MYTFICFAYFLFSYDEFLFYFSYSFLFCPTTGFLEERNGINGNNWLTTIIPNVWSGFPWPPIHWTIHLLVFISKRVTFICRMLEYEYVQIITIFNIDGMNAWRPPDCSLFPGCRSEQPTKRSKKNYIFGIKIRKKKTIEF